MSKGIKNKGELHSFKNWLITCLKELKTKANFTYTYALTASPGNGIMISWEGNGLDSLARAKGQMSHQGADKGW
jgi:hypothetical protein